MYIWETDVLMDFTKGLVCVHAETLERALELAEERIFSEKLGKPDRVLEGEGVARVHGGG